MTVKKSVWIVIPIYNRADLVKQCVDSVLAAAVETQFHICLIDDASTELEVKSLLEEYGKDPRFTCIRNDENLGFTRTVNIGIKAAGSSHPLLLNSDTVVYDHWLDELVGLLESEPMIGSVTPVTNQRGSHLSCYPDAAWSMVSAIEDPDATIARAAYDACRGLSCEVHTGVGFCLLLNRRCLDEIGFLDEINFPRGYGEESDLCYRASYLGWRHRIAGGCFVTHLHAQSFGTEKERLRSAMISVFRELHPSQPALDRSFRERDPMWPVRRKIDLGRLKLGLAGRTEIKITKAKIDHSVGDHFLKVNSASEDTIELQLSSITTSYPNVEPYFLPTDAALLENDLGLVGIRNLTVDESDTSLVSLLNSLSSFSWLNFSASK